MKAQDEGNASLTRSHRVQRTGRSSLSVTLPKSWTKALNIHTGDPVTLRQRGDGTLELDFATPHEGPEGGIRSVSIDAAGARACTVGRLLVGAYVSGQDHIVVAHLSDEARRSMAEIDQVVKHLVGTSLIRDAAGGLEYEVYVDPAKYQHSTLHNRLSQMLRMEIEILRKVLEGEDPHLLAQIRPIEDEVDRFYYLIVRQVNLASNDYRLARVSGMANHSLQLGCRLIAKMLEVLSDLLNEIGEELEKGLLSGTPSSGEARGEFTRMFVRLEKLLESTTSGLIEVDAPTSDQTLEEIRSAYVEFSVVGDRLSKGSRDKESVALVRGVIVRLLMALEMLRVVNETLINQAISPERVADTGFQPVGAGTPPRP